MTTEELSRKIAELEQVIIRSKTELYRLKKQMPRFQMQDYLLHGRQGQPIHLSELFGNKKELILVHNMGSSCPYCTLWADGLNGLYKHLEDRAAFAVSTPDHFSAMDKFAAGRGWNFRMVTTEGSTLKKDLGFQLADGSFYPGVSTLLRDEKGDIYHVAKAFFGPGDDFCALWYLFDMLAVENPDWEPKFSY